jgi:hypothetical protein
MSISFESQLIAFKICSEVIGLSSVKDTHVLTTLSPNDILSIKVLEASGYTRSFLKQRTDTAVAR